MSGDGEQPDHGPDGAPPDDPRTIYLVAASSAPTPDEAPDPELKRAA
jgi:hypothetical protein